jgi:hypothetical protein
MRFLINLFKVLNNLDILVESIERGKLFKKKKPRKRRTLHQDAADSLRYAMENRKISISADKCRDILDAHIDDTLKVDRKGFKSLELQDKAMELLS